jgi:hypothetical protein
MSISSCTQSRRLLHEPQFTQDPNSGMDTDMEEAAAKGPITEVPVAPTSKPGPKAPMIEGSSATDTNDVDFVYDRIVGAGVLPQHPLEGWQFISHLGQRYGDPRDP